MVCFIVNVCLDGVDYDVIKVVFYILFLLFIILLFISLIYNWYICNILIDIDECVVLLLCCNGGSCVNNLGLFFCSCVLGWIGMVCEKGIIGIFYWYI